MSRALFRRLRNCRDGVAVVEFALVFPVFLLLLIGSLDMGQMVYAKAVLHGAVEEAARTSSLETGNTASADAKVVAVVGPVLPGAVFASKRASYFDFTDIERAEAWNDEDNSGACDNGESFTDENGNGDWDQDIGEAGNGGAGDVVLYTVTVSYSPTFAVPLFTDRNGMRTLTASAVKKNQPFSSQTEYGSESGVCD